MFVFELVPNLRNQLETGAFMNGYVLISLCLSVMLCILFFRAKYYNMKWYKVIIVAIYTGAMGLLGTKIMFLIENGYWYGRSFFGAVLFLPALVWPLAVVLKIKLFELLGYVTPPGMAMLALYKYNCYLDGCCGGKVMFYSEDGVPTYFPSQLAEMLCAVLVTALLLFVEQKKKTKKTIYPLCLIVYGIIRFGLNFFRWEQSGLLCGISAGHFWSALSAIIGASILVYFVIADKKVGVNIKKE